MLLCEATADSNTDQYHFCMFLVHFRFVVFRPFIDEILTGRIRSCNHEGLQGKDLIVKQHVV